MMRMLLTLLLTTLTATLGENTHTLQVRGALAEGEGVALLSSGLAGSGSQEEGASLTWTGGHTAADGERVIHFYKYLQFTYVTCHL